MLPIQEAERRQKSQKSLAFSRSQRQLAGDLAAGRRPFGQQRKQTGLVGNDQRWDVHSRAQHIPQQAVFTRRYFERLRLRFHGHVRAAGRTWVSACPAARAFPCVRGRRDSDRAAAAPLSAPGSSEVDWGSAKVEYGRSHDLRYFLGSTASFSCLAIRAFTTVFAGILIASPVAGLRPIRALRF